MRINNLKYYMLGLALCLTACSPFQQLQKQDNDKTVETSIVKSWNKTELDYEKSSQNLFYVIELDTVNNNHIISKIEKEINSFGFKYDINNSQQIYRNNDVKVMLWSNNNGDLKSIMVEYNKYPSLIRVSSNLDLIKIENRCYSLSVDESETKETFIIYCNQSKLL